MTSILPSLSCVLTTIWTYRETEAFFRDLFPEKPCPSFQALHWYMRKKLKEEELTKLLELLKERLGPFLEKNSLLILDSTGIAQRGKTQELRWMRGRFPRVVQGHARLCLTIRYLKEPRLLLPVGMSVGEGYAPDPLLGAKALSSANPGGVLLADAGFDSGKVYEEAEGKFIPMIQLKGGGQVKDPKRKEARKTFRAEVYRLRAVGEGVFGAIKTRLNGRLRNLKLSCTQKESLLLVVCYVLRVLLAFLCFLLGIQRLRGRERVHWAVHNAAWAPR
ncbi:MAG: transposase [Candidatus Bipolaricaulaceae bacterium]